LLEDSTYFAVGWRRFFKPNFSDVALANPDILIFEFENGRRKEIHKLIAQRKWNDLAAVKHDRILEMQWTDRSMAHPGPLAINTISVLSAKIREIFPT
jgi:ABC-type Fe3+-hydroxamate transport system substrate-binding protein